MSRKKRRFEQLEEAASKPKEKVAYRDPFQEAVGTRIEAAGKKLEGKGRTILYAIAAIAAASLIIWVIYSSMSRSSAEAQTALGKAIETSQAQVTANPPAADATHKTFKTERERAEAAIAEFTAVAEKFGGDVGEKAKYFAAVTRLAVDRPAAITELQSLASTSGAVGKQAKFALAQAFADDGNHAEAERLYRELLADGEPVVAKETLKFGLAGILEKQDKKTEAADLYFEIAKAASEAKDMDGKPVPMSDTAQKAKDKLKDLDPEREKQIVVPVPDNPFGN